MTTTIHRRGLPVPLLQSVHVERNKLARNRAGVKGAPWWNVVPVTESGDGAELLIFGYIDSWGEDWGVSAPELVDALAGVQGRPLTVRINSGGGEVFEGFAIYNALLRHDAPVNVVIDGLAASAASFIAMAGDTVTMMRTSTMMIHDASGLVIGNAADMRSMADVLDKLSDSIADTYARRSGGEVATWRDEMRTERWLNADEALALGLIDRVEDPDRGKPDAATNRAPAATETPAPPVLPTADRPRETSARDRAAAQIRVRKAQGRNPA
jgi:ATP-dependent protease ClpP protease subunit